MDKIKTALDAYYDGIYSEKDALYHIVLMDAPTVQVRDIMFDWMNLTVQGKATIKRLKAAVDSYSGE